MANSPLLEREPVLAAVDDLLARARGGEGGTLLIAADAGVGKSAVLAEASRRAKGFRVGVGRGDGVEAALPYGVLHQALSRIDDRSPLHEFDPATVVTDARASLFYSVMRWLQRSGPEPLFIGLDDLQWADADSLALVSVICRRITALPVVVVATMRPFPETALGMARTLAGDGFAEVHRLQPLSAAGTNELLASRTRDDLASPIFEHAWRLTAGNPLLIEQAVAMLDRDGTLPATDGDATAAHGLLVSRFAGVSEMTLRWARAASVLGVSFRSDIAGEIADLSRPEVDEALDELSRAGIVRAEGDAVPGFVHPLFRAALYDDIGTALRQRWHGRAFALLHAAGAGDAVAAEHARLSDLAGDETAVAVLTRAGRAAINAGAAASAERHFRAAARLGAEATPPEAHLGLAEALLLTGRAAAAIDVAAALLEDPALDSEVRVDTLRTVGRANFYAGVLAEADRSYAAAVATSAAREEPVLAAEVALEYAAVALFAAGPVLALPVAERARTMVVALDHPVAAAADLAWALSTALAGQPAEPAVGDAAAHRLIEGRATDRAASLALHGAEAGMAERFEEAERSLAVAREWAERGGDPVILSLIATASAVTALRRGRLGAALDYSSRAVELGDTGPAGVAWATAVHGEVLLQLGQEGGPGQRPAAVTPESGHAEWLPDLWSRLTAMQRLLAAGRATDAAREADVLESVAGRAGVLDPCFVPWVGEAIGAHAAAGNFDAVTRLLATVGPIADAIGCAWPRAAVARGQALLSEHARAAAAGLEILEAAAADAGLNQLPLDRLRLDLDRGRMLRRNGRVADSRALLGVVVHGAESLGAIWVVQQATAELHVAGGRRRRRDSGDGLTAAEGRVAALAAEGLSNAEIATQLFVSAKTVDTHLQHVYAKLGINSRRELMRAWAAAQPREDA